MNYRLPDTIGYPMWIKDTEWKIDFLKSKEKKKCRSSAGCKESQFYSLPFG